MTGFEIINQNKKRYEAQLLKNEKMDGLAKRVGETMMLAWIKGDKWMGGLSDRKADSIISRLEKEGFSENEIIDEFHKQMMEYW